MLEVREWLGSWNIHLNQPNRVYQGILTYSPDKGGELKLSKENAYLDEFSLLGQSSFIPIIKGYDHHSGKSITLINSIVINSSWSAGLKLVIHPNLIIENLDYQDQSSLQFLTATVVFAGLSPWLAITGITKTLKDDGQRFTGVSMEYQQPESLKFDIHDLFKVQIDFGYSPGNDPRTFTGYALTETCYVSLICKEPGMHIEELLKWMEHYRRLFCPLFGQPCFITYYRITTSLELSLESQCNVFYKNTVDGFPKRPPNSNQMRTLYKYIDTPFSSLLNKWAEYHQSGDLDYVAWITSKNFSRFSEETFLEVARALEVFCGATMDTRLYSEDEKNSFRNAIKKKLTITDLYDNNTNVDIEKFNNMIEKISGQVSYVDFLSLRKKIKLALKIIQEKTTVESFNKLFPNSKLLPEIIVGYRNYYTHYDDNSIKSIKGQELTIDQLVELARKVKMILILLIFNNLGMSIQSIANNLIRNDIN